MKNFKKDLFFIVLFICFFFLTSNSFAQEETKVNLTESYDQTVKTVNRAHGQDDEEYNSARSQAVNANTTVSNAIVFLAPEVTEGYEAILNDPDIGWDMKRGLYGMANDGVTAMFINQPSIDVIAHLSEEWVPGYKPDNAVYAGLVKTGYESGYEELMSTGVSTLWTQMRNIAYVFFFLIMVVVGFMIMFRSKIGGQTLVTLGNAIPNIIIALIGVTFSFAIAGIIIDIGGVIMVLIANMFENTSEYANLVSTGTMGEIFKTFTNGGLFSEKPYLTKTAGVGGSVFSIIGGVGMIAGSAAIFPWLLGAGIVALLIFLAVLGVAFVGTFKVFLTLAKAYIGILVNVITGPIQIAISAVPGKQNMFINWVLSILRNVLVYPIVFAIVNLPGVLANIPNSEINLPGPDKLTLIQNANQMDSGTGIFTGPFMIAILQIFALFLASRADKYAQVIIPPTTSQAAGNAAQEAKRALSGIPLVGSLLGK